MNKYLLLLLFIPHCSWALQQSYELSDVQALYANNGFIEASVRYRADGAGVVHGAAFHLIYDPEQVLRIELVENKVAGFMGFASPARNSSEPAYLAAWFDPESPLDIRSGDEMLRVRMILAEGVSAETGVRLSAVASPGFSTVETEFSFDENSTNIEDLDGDSVADGTDNCRLEFNPSQLDTDSDDLGDACDDDDDNDGYPDLVDDYPLDADLPASLSRSFVPMLLNVLDQLDSDGDGLSDIREMRIGTNRFSRDSDGDTLSDLQEVELGLNPLQRDTDNDGYSDDLELRSGTNAKDANQKPVETENSGFKYWYLFLEK